MLFYNVVRKKDRRVFGKMYFFGGFIMRKGLRKRLMTFALVGALAFMPMSGRISRVSADEDESSVEHEDFSPCSTLAAHVTPPLPLRESGRR